MNVIGYVRVSTDRQAEQGVSLEAQEAKIRAMATVQSVELLEVIVDGGESPKKRRHYISFHSVSPLVHKLMRAMSTPVVHFAPTDVQLCLL
jgi:hypothetical protein